jgi:hypothetical protein
LRCTLKAITGVLIKKKAEGALISTKKRSWNRAGMGVVQHCKPEEARREVDKEGRRERRKEGLFFGASLRRLTLISASGHENHKRMNFYCFKPPCGWSFVTVTPGTKYRKSQWNGAPLGTLVRL